MLHDDTHITHLLQNKLNYTWMLIMLSLYLHQKVFPMWVN